MKARLDTTTKEQWVLTGDEGDASANPQPRDTGETRLLDGSSTAQLLPLRHTAAGWQVAVGWPGPSREPVMGGAWPAVGGPTPSPTEAKDGDPGPLTTVIRSPRPGADANRGEGREVWRPGAYGDENLEPSTQNRR
jgi:hypothetical protein